MVAQHCTITIAFICSNNNIIYGTVNLCKTIEMLVATFTCWQCLTSDTDQSTTNERTGSMSNGIQLSRDLLVLVSLCKTDPSLNILVQRNHRKGLQTLNS